MVKANINEIALAIRSDLESLSRCSIDHYSRNYMNDLMGTLAVNMEVFAKALNEEREGRTDFFGGVPSECVDRILGD